MSLTEMDKRIYQEVVVDDVYQLKKYKPDYIVDIGAYKCHVLEAMEEYGNNFVYYGFDENIVAPHPEHAMLSGESNSRFFRKNNITESGSFMLSWALKHAHYNRLLRMIDMDESYCTMVKIDIQGYEKYLIQANLFGLLQRNYVHVIALEWHYPDELPSLLNNLIAHGFEPVSVKAHHDTMDDMDTHIVIAESLLYQKRSKG
jgi:hypothetical protein